MIICFDTAVQMAMTMHTPVTELLKMRAEDFDRIAAALGRVLEQQKNKPLEQQQTNK